MNPQTFSNISKIIERDSKFSTYKFALLRGTIDIIQENSPYITKVGDAVEIPLGLLIEKWVLYYYPLFDTSLPIPQINGEKNNLAFGSKLVNVVEYYRHRGGLSSLYSDLRSCGVSFEISKTFIQLVKSIKETIVKQPMYYLGRSISHEFYSIYKYIPQKGRTGSGKIDTQWLINSFGHFTIPYEYFEAFKTLGSFLAGTDSLLFKWAEFSVNASRSVLSTESVISEILKAPVTERDSEISKRIYREVLSTKKGITCVWSGNHIQRYDVDHLIPFTIWKNNDLWNLLPATPTLNNHKRAKIVSVVLLEKRRDIIIDYWEQIKDKYEDRFFSELSVSLIGSVDTMNWQLKAFNQLKKTTEDLINIRGYEEWSYTA